MSEEWVLGRAMSGVPALRTDVRDYIWSEGRECIVRRISRSATEDHAANHYAARGPPDLDRTQNGEAKAVVQDIDSYEQMQESMALLKMLALGNRQIDAGRVQPAAEVIARLRERHQAD